MYVIQKRHMKIPFIILLILRETSEFDFLRKDLTVFSFPCDRCDDVGNLDFRRR